jgi:hypothetical protein
VNCRGIEGGERRALAPKTRALPTMSVVSLLERAKAVFLCIPSLLALPLKALSHGRLTFRKIPTVLALVVAPAGTLLAIVLLVRLVWLKRLSAGSLLTPMAAVLLTVCLDLYFWWWIAGI